LAKVSDFDVDGADFDLGWDTSYSGHGLSRGFLQLLQENVNTVHQITP